MGLLLSFSKVLVQRGIALTFFIEIVDKELLKYEVENIRWGYTCMIDEHGKARAFLSLREKGLFCRKVPYNMAVVLHACFVPGNFFYIKAQPYRSKTQVSVAVHHAPSPYFCIEISERLIRHSFITN